MQQQIQVNQQQSKLVEVNQAQEVVNQEDEATILKDNDEINQSKQVPLFNYRPIFHSEKQQQNDSSYNIFQKQNSMTFMSFEKKILCKQLYKSQKQQSIYEEDSLNNFKDQKDSFIQKQSIDDKQTLSAFSESAISLKNQNSQQKSIFKDSQFNQSVNYNLNDIDFVKNINVSQYKQHLENISQNYDQNSIQCLQKLKAIQDKSTSNKIQKLMFKFRLCKGRKKPEEMDVLNEKQQQKIENQINQNLDILNFFNDMIFLKKAIMLLLRKDQLAALKLVGFSRNILELDLKNIDAKKQLSYYEMQYAILQSENLQQHQMEKFLKRCQNNHKLTQIDCRILQSLKANEIL
ncbi:hypothetical protein ABPG74_004861 [Tetrahymena malaccensis]